MLSGASPFAGDTVGDVIAAVLMKEPKTLTNVPPELEKIVQKTLQKDKSARYQSATDLLDDLREVKQELEIQSRLEKSGAQKLEEPQTRIFQAPTTAEKSHAATTGSEPDFWVAVLPFKYRGANADLEALAEGLSEEIITGLSRFSYLQIIAHTSAARFSTGEFADVRSIGKELGARYLLEGNLRLAGNKLRLAVRLVDAAMGGNLWAENFERGFSPEAVFDLQDDLVPRIVSTCGDHFGVLVRSICDTVRGQNPQQLSPYEALMRGFGYHYRLSRQEHAQARDVLEKAVSESPNNADCQAMLSWVYSHEYAHGFNPLPGSLDRALAAARLAVELAPSNHLAYQTLAVAHFFRKEKAACLSAADRALSLNPLDASNEAIFLITFADDWERGCTLIRRAMELNPYCPGWYWLILGLNEYRKTNYREAAAVAVKANATGGWADVIFAAIHGQLGEQEAARNAVQNLIAAKMNSLEAVRELGAKWFDSQLVEHLLEGIGKAGLKPVSAQNSEESKTQILLSVTTAETETGNSIAVLPFTNMSADEDNEYFCDGLAEELLNALSKIEDLRVAARTSAFSFKGKNANVGEIGEKLGVRNVLEGSVRRSGDKLRISVQLVNASDGYQLWSERYDREMKDIFDVQDEIALAVARALKVKLFGDEKALLLKRYTANTDVYEIYLKGRYQFQKHTPEGWQQAAKYFQQAIDLDPEYAPAFAGLSSILTFQSFFGFVTAGEAIPNAKAAALRALEIDSELDEAHLALGQISMFYEWNLEKAEREYQAAIRLNPKGGFAHHQYGLCLSVMKKPDQAIVEAEKAMEYEPFSVIGNLQAAAIYLWNDRDEGHLKYANRLIEIAPDFFGGYLMRGILLLKQGRYDEAIVLFQEALSFDSRQGIVKSFLGKAYALAGKKDKAFDCIEQLQSDLENNKAASYQIAGIYSSIGDLDRTFEWLEKAFAERNGELIYLKLYANWRNGEIWGHEFRTDPRFQDLLRRIGFSADKTNQTGESLEAKTAMLSTGEVISKPPAKDFETRTAETKPTTESTTNPKSEIHNPKSKWWLFGLLGFVVLVGGFFGYKYFAPTDGQIESIAVMPFVNESGTPDVEYLSDGMTEMLIKSLSQLPNLAVKSRSAVFYYKGKETSPQKIGGELNVQAVLLGRIVQRGDDLKLSLELVNTTTQDVIWSESYDRKQSDLVSLQSEIARDVSGKLKSKLSGADEAKVVKTSTSNPEAYQAYLKGRYYWNRRTAENLKKATEQFKLATDRDPNYALAFTGLADSYALAPEYAGTPWSETAPQARKYAERAIALDRQLGEPHATLAIVAHKLWQWDEAEKEFKQAIELNPNYATAFHWYSILLKDLGRYDEAEKAIKRAAELDPLSGAIGCNISMIYQVQNDQEASVKNSLKLIELDPSFGRAYEYLGLSYLKLGRKEEAVKTMEKAVELTNRQNVVLSELGYVYGRTGNRDKALAVARELEARYVRKEAAGHEVAAVYSGLGEKDKAFEWLEKDFQAKDGRLTTFRWETQFEPLRDDPRYKNLLKRMNLPG